MATADTIIRVSRSEAEWLASIRDRNGFASVAVVVELLRQRVGEQFEESLHQAIRSPYADDRTA